MNHIRTKNACALLVAIDYFHNAYVALPQTGEVRTHSQRHRHNHKQFAWRVCSLQSNPTYSPQYKQQHTTTLLFRNMCFLFSAQNASTVHQHADKHSRTMI